MGAEYLALYVLHPQQAIERINPAVNEVSNLKLLCRGRYDEVYLR